MKTSFAIAVLLGIATAAPAIDLETRQITDNDVEQGSCAGKKAAFVFARGSTEPGNMGELLGPQVCSGLKNKYNGQVACQEVGGAYTAGLADNVSEKGTTDAAIREATKMLTDAMSKCPDAAIVAGGYSQGSAVMLNAIESMTAEQKARIAGVVLFGYTKNKQENGEIPGFPVDKLKVFCRPDDGVCGGALVVTAGHLGYSSDGSIGQAVDFLSEKVASFNGTGVASPAVSDA
ncbi:hypothetical protein LTS18_007705 [Coniosporium uncinatum]|uniref:Uncharacterized protein n=1 Tax=Coniosporium uncinatum TaxID=93489 RepID=A0ACC3DWZ5_9PEZI|nr:hypothetical protein LTS18_007705 [Coniosporium uncinatum]